MAEFKFVFGAARVRQKTHNLNWAENDFVSTRPQHPNVHK